MNKYGDLPVKIAEVKIEPKEMLFYQYLPIKLQYEKFNFKTIEPRLTVYNNLIAYCLMDFTSMFGFKELEERFIYLTVKYLYQTKNNSFNRQGYHTDGFLTEDINYIWSDNCPTIFNSSEFNLTLDDKISMVEMEQQALKENEVVYDNNTLLRLNEFNVHKVGDTQEGFRNFFKLSFSKDRYNLLGNSHNYLLDYNWEMEKRQTEKNIPQLIIK